MNTLATIAPKIIADYNRLSLNAQSASSSKDTTVRSNVELEVRLDGVNKESFISMLKNMYSKNNSFVVDQSLTCTNIDMVKNIKNKRMKQQFYEYKNNKLVKSNEFYSEKDTYDHINIISPFRARISIAIEKMISPIKISDMNSVVRFKFRLSFIIDEFRYDFTAIKTNTLHELTNTMESVKQKVFADVNENTSLDIIIAHLDNFSSYEIEIEYVDSKNINLETFNMMVDNISTILLSSVSNNMIYLNAITSVAKLLGHPKELINGLYQEKIGLKKMIPQVIGLDMLNYNEIFPPIGYYLTDKADGERCLFFADGNNIRLIFGGNKIITLAENTSTKINLFDGELIEISGDNNEKIKYYLIFDTMIINNNDISLQPFSSRLSSLMDAERFATNYIKSIGKRYSCISEENIKMLLESTYKGPFPLYKNAEIKYHRDGIIFSSGSENYLQSIHYKWKPAIENSIDFLCVPVPPSLLGTKPYIETDNKKLYILMSGMTYEAQNEIGITFMEKYKEIISVLKPTGKVYPLQFSPSINPFAYIYAHDDSSGINLSLSPYNIVEMAIEMVTLEQRAHEVVTINNVKTPRWKILRIREDRKTEKGYYGNPFSIAETTYLSIYNPLNFEDLSKPKSGYFAIDVSPAYKMSNKYKRFVIEKIFQANIKNAKWIVDLAAGRGADLHRYRRLNVRNVLFVDIDVSAVMELISRKYTKIREKYSHHKITNIVNKSVNNGGNSNSNSHPTHNHIANDLPIIKTTNILAMIQDLKNPAAVVLANMANYGTPIGSIDGVVCNFALHYFCDSPQNLKQMVELIAKLVRKGGIFIFTVMDGERVFTQCAESGKYIIIENNTTKYAITAKYTGKKLANTGQLIDVKLPFSATPYTEPLCNIDYVIKEFTNSGFALELNNNFDDKLAEFAEDKRKTGGTKIENLPAIFSNYEELSTGDIDYIKLHRYVSLRRM